VTGQHEKKPETETGECRERAVSARAGQREPETGTGDRERRHIRNAARAQVEDGDARAAQGYDSHDRFSSWMRQWPATARR